jgi:hypothetical protein
MRIVRNRSIPNVDNARLAVDIARIHAAFHTPAGLAAFDGPRRNLGDMGRKGKAIAAEMIRRGMPAPDCSFCAPN